MSTRQEEEKSGSKGCRINDDAKVWYDMYSVWHD